MIATARYEIVKPTSCDWKVLSDNLKSVQRVTGNILNRVIQHCWEWQGFSAEYKAQHDVYPKPGDVLGKTLEGYVYDQLKQEFPTLQTGNLSQTIQVGIRKWKADLKEVRTGERSIASFRRDVPIVLHNKSIRLRKAKNGDYLMNMSLLSRAGCQEAGLSSGMFDIKLAAPDDNRKMVLERIMSGEYKLASSKIMYHRRKKSWFVNLTYQFEMSTRTFDPKRIVGVDLGQAVAAFCAVSDSKARLRIDGGEIEQFRKRVVAQRKSILRATPYAGPGRVGHGRTKLLQPAERLEERIINFRKTKNEGYARKIVDLAVANECGTIQMEDLSGISTDDKFLRDWTYFDLRMKIEQAAAKEGIQVVLVKPAYTSQRCSYCGHIDEANRPERDTFRCTVCDYHTHADYNAARNLAIEGIDVIIAEWMGQKPNPKGKPGKTA